MARGTKDINHAQLVDDIILLGGASPIMTKRFKSKLESYCKASGSKLNMRKSHIFNWNTNLRELFVISRILRIVGVTHWDSFKYLGVPIFKASQKATNWNPLVEKIKNKILS